MFVFVMITGSIKEVELKVLGVSYPLLVRTLKKLGVQKVGSVYIRDRYVDNNKQLKRQSKTARLRSYGWEQFEITIKSKIASDDYKIRHEENIQVPSLEVGKLMLHMMWCECIWYKEKIRVTYQVGETKFDIDFYDDMPPVLEIEGTETEIQHWIRKLRLQNHKQVTRWAKKLFKHYGKSVQKMWVPMHQVSM
jgi:adenylate cyclase class IV